MNKSLIKIIEAAKDVGRREGIIAGAHVAAVAVHNIVADNELLDDEGEVKITRGLGAEMERILQIDEHTSAEDIGMAVVNWCSKNGAL